jgi:hypothetical protein
VSLAGALVLILAVVVVGVLIVVFVGLFYLRLQGRRSLDTHVLLNRATTLGPTWLELDAALVRTQENQSIELAFLHGIPRATLDEPRSGMLAPLGVSGNRVLPEVELRDAQGHWHRISANGLRGNDWLCYTLENSAPPGPFTAARLRSEDRVTVTQAVWYCHTSVF